MSDLSLALLFTCMMIGPCLAARLVCSGTDRDAVLIVQPNPSYWE